MPTYEYECDACGHEMEVFHSIMARPLRKCPKCGKSRLRRLIGTGAGVIFKGSGFYETDYRSDNYKAGAKAETDKSAGKSEGSGGKDGASDASSSKSEGSATKSDTSSGKSDSAAGKSDGGSAKADASSHKTQTSKSGDSKSHGAKKGK